MREDYAVKLSERLGRRRRELEAGAVRATGTTLEEAEARFYSSLVKKRPRRCDLPRRHRPLSPVGEAKSRSDVRRLDERSRHGVSRMAASRGRFATHLQQTTSGRETHARVLGGRGPMSESGPFRLAAREAGTSGDRTPRILAAYQVKRLLEACERHDAETYSMTRHEKAAGKPRKVRRRATRPLDRSPCSFSYRLPLSEALRLALERRRPRSRGPFRRGRWRISNSCVRVQNEEAPRGDSRRQPRAAPPTGRAEATNGRAGTRMAGRDRGRRNKGHAATSHDLRSPARNSRGKHYAERVRPTL